MLVKPFFFTVSAVVSAVSSGVSGVRVYRGYDFLDGLRFGLRFFRGLELFFRLARLEELRRLFFLSLMERAASAASIVIGFSLLSCTVSEGLL